MQNNPPRRSNAPQAPSAPQAPHAAEQALLQEGTPPAGRHAAEESLEEVIHYLDDMDLGRFLRVAAAFDGERYAYAVTPNIDHLIRCHEDPAYRALYRSADYVLLDSRFAAHLLRAVKGLRLPTCPGSDLFPRLLKTVVRPLDRLVLIGGTEDQARSLAREYGLKNLSHHNPPMGFIKDRQAVERCLELIERASPFRFCFLMVGAPQQELLAHELKTRGRALGLVLCLGASLNFLTGVERRAPVWMRRVGLEWLYRLLRDPRRLARRYLVRGPRIFGHLRRARFVLRPNAD